MFLDNYQQGGIEQVMNMIIDSSTPEMTYDILSFSCSKNNPKVKSLLEKNYRSFLVRNMKGIPRLKEFLKHHSYDLIHIHAYNAMGLYYAHIAKKYCRRIIIHAHNSDIDHNPLKIKSLINNLLIICFKRDFSHKIAVSQEASKFCFGKECDLLPNGIDYKRFAYNSKERKIWREKYQVQNKLVIGQIGRLEKQKNQSFTLDILKEVVSRNKNVHCFFIGEGKDQKKLEKKVKKLKLEFYVTFLGYQKEVEKIMNMFDIMVYPSIYEGFGNSIIESQVNGRITLMSENVSENIMISNNSYRLSLKNKEAWINIILKGKTKRLELNNKHEIENFRYNIEQYYKRVLKKKFLLIANSDRHIKLCHIPYLKLFSENNYEVHVASNSNISLPFCDKKIKINLKRNPYSFLNFFAVFQLRNKLKKENYDILSCHTPIGGFLGRASTIALKQKPLVFYTVHGFHFYKSCSFKNKLIYYPIEKFLSRFSDAILTMNEEDYEIATEKFHCDIYKIHGIGMNLDHLKKKEKNLKHKLGFENKFVITYIAEISKRKNQLPFLEATKNWNLEEENIEILLVGDSIIKNIKQIVQKYPHVTYLDFKENVADYIEISDAIFSVSKQEGLPQNILEAMYFNKMIFAFDIRGNRDLIKNHQNGVLLPINDFEGLYKEILNYKNRSPKPIQNHLEAYLLESVLEEVKKIYNHYLKEKIS